MRKYAEEAAKQVEPLRKRERELEMILVQRDDTIKDMQG